MTRRRLAIGLAAGAATACVAGLVWLASAAPLAWLPATVAGLGPMAPVVFVPLAALMLALLVPRTPVSLAAGLLFGAATGAVCALAVALLAGAVTFVLGRRLGRHVGRRIGSRAGRPCELWSRSWGGRRARQVARLAQTDGILAVAAVRALPIGPYGLVGYAFGASTVRARHYALGTLIAATPSAVTTAILGAAIAGAPPRDPLTLAPLAFGLALSTVVLVRAGRAGRSKQAQRPSGEKRVDQLTGAGQER